MTEICLYRLFWGGTQVYANLIALFFLNCLLDSHASQLALVVKNLPAKAGDTRETGLISESQRPTRERNDNLLQDSCLENSVDRGSW